MEQGNIFRSVCQEFCSQGGGGMPHCMLGYPTAPPGSRPPGADPLGAEPPSRHPPEQTPPGAVHAGRYGQQAGSTHPTGMQYCFVLRLG